MATALENALRTATRAVAKAIGPKGNVLRRTIEGYDEETQGTVAQITDYPIEPLPVAEYGSHAIDGKNVLAGDVKVSLPAKDMPKDAAGNEIKPSEETDTVVLASTTYKIVRVGFVTGGVLPAMYVMQCRK